MGEFTDKAKGTAKEIIGEAKQHSSNPETRAEGTAQKIDGKTVVYTITCSATNCQSEVSGTVPLKFLPKV
jgi:hypothetical protein